MDLHDREEFPEVHDSKWHRMVQRLKGPALKQRRTITVPGSAFSQPLSAAPDLQTQLEELLNEVWRQESFERKHPFTCEVIRETHAVRRRKV